MPRLWHNLRMIRQLPLLVLPLLCSWATADTLTFAGNANLEPMIYVDGKPRGLVVDLTQALTDAAELNVEITAMDWSEAQNRLLAGNVDALMQINPNPERLKRMAFSDPLLVTDFTLFRRTERLDLIAADSLNGQRIGADRASSPAKLVANIDGAIPIDIDRLSDGLRAVSVGTLDGIVVDHWVGLHLIKQLGIENLTPAGQPLATSTSRIAVLKDRTALLADINRGLRLIDESGERQRILNAWSGTHVVLLSQTELRRWGWITALAFVVMAGVAVAVYIRALKTRNQMAQHHADELKRVNTKLSESNHQLTHFTLLSSQHFHAPLHQISVNLTLMRELTDNPIEGAALDHLALVEDGARCMRVMISDVLDYAQIDQGRDDDCVDLNLVASSAIDALDHRISRARGRVEHTGLPMVNGDRMLLIRLFRHLIDNSLTFTRQGEPPRLRISAERHADQWHMSFNDNGTGIDDRYHEQAFELFERLAPARSQGTGIGLAISRRIARHLRGDLHIAASSPRGTCFNLSLPIITTD